MKCLIPILLLIIGLPQSWSQDSPQRNIVMILSDDHRYDFMGFMDDAPEFLETPHFDRLAKEGGHLANAFVSTSLCSPSRASILTGQYMHHHRVVDNQRPVEEGTRFSQSICKKRATRRRSLALTPALKITLRCSAGLWLQAT